MKITVTGSLGHISKPLAEALVLAGHEVTIISSNADRKAAIEALGAKAAIGSVTDVAFLTNAFTGADAVYTMVPPNFGAPNVRQFIAETGSNYASAIKAAGVKRVVNLSSVGAHLPGGTGPIAGLHDVEHSLNGLDGVAIKHLRAGFFYINFLGNIGMIKNMNIMGSNYGDTRMVLVHPRDIAAAAAAALQQPLQGKSYEYVISDESTTTAITKAIGAAVGKPELPWVEFTDAQAYDGMTQAGLPPAMANAYVEMGTAVRSRALWEDYDLHKPASYGKTKLADFVKEFAAAYQAS